jgi:hypothetical protein
MKASPTQPAINPVPYRMTTEAQVANQVAWHNLSMRDAVARVAAAGRPVSEAGWGLAPLWRQRYDRGTLTIASYADGICALGTTAGKIVRSLETDPNNPCAPRRVGYHPPADPDECLVITQAILAADTPKRIVRLVPAYVDQDWVRNAFPTWQADRTAYQLGTTLRHRLETETPSQRGQILAGLERAVDARLAETPTAPLRSFLSRTQATLELMLLHAGSPGRSASAWVDAMLTSQGSEQHRDRRDQLIERISPDRATRWLATWAEQQAVRKQPLRPEIITNLTMVALSGRTMPCLEYDNEASPRTVEHAQRAVGVIAGRS